MGMAIILQSGFNQSSIYHPPRACGARKKMTELTLHLGLQGDRSKINLHWHDHDNIEHQDQVEVFMLDRDKPRIIQVYINSMFAMEHVAGCGPTYRMNQVPGQPSSRRDFDVGNAYVIAWPLPPREEWW